MRNVSFVLFILASRRSPAEGESTCISAFWIIAACMSSICAGVDIVNAAIELVNADGAAKISDKAGYIFEELRVAGARRETSNKQSTLPFWRVDRAQHIESGATEASLHGAVPMKDVVVLLVCAILFCEVNEPVTPTVWIVDRKGLTYCAQPRRNRPLAVPLHRAICVLIWPSRSKYR